jgi:NhaP-type Na+/H+ or K+/H+ antiporter
MHDVAANPSLTVALALAAGIVAQSVALHLRVPGIVFLLAMGVLLGPDGIGIVKPHDLGHGLHMLVGFAIAVILFEGGLNLDWRRLRREAATIRMLVTVGAIITWGGGALAARLILGWSWSLSILFGSLVIVTGPTVITPLLRRIKVQRKIETILEAEGVFIDAVGAIIAVVALEVVLSTPTSSSLAVGFITVPTRLVLGAVVGVVGGFAAAGLLRVRGVVPEGLENVFTLALALAIFQVSNALSPESGIVAVIVAGMVVGNSRTEVKQELKEFKEQLTVMLIGMLFVLLAADVRVASVVGLGGAGLLVVAALMFVVRPIDVLACTVTATMSWRDRAFLSWLAPRGIVAFAVATLFYERLSAQGIAGGDEMRALVFLVIAVTVVFQGLTGGVVAGWLGLRRPSGRGYVILGSHYVGIELGRLLVDAGEDVVFIDANPEQCRLAQEAGFRVFHGNALEERVLVSAGLDTRRAVVATLPNEAVNLLFARKARGEYRVPEAFVAIQRGHGAFSPEVVHEAGASVLFGNEVDLELWDVRIRRKLVEIVPLRYLGAEHDQENEGDGGRHEDPDAVPREMQNVVMPFARINDGKVYPLGDRTRVEKDSVLFWMIFRERAEEGEVWLDKSGWTRELGRDNRQSEPESASDRGGNGPPMGTQPIGGPPAS